MPDGTPVIGPTLRYDRIDNFWFCLLHELAHIVKHLTSSDRVIIDDFDLLVHNNGSDDSINRRLIRWLVKADPPKGMGGEPNQRQGDSFNCNRISQQIKDSSGHRRRESQV
jgi:HTH-type transcriptional regulator / antitoxin HigA